MSITASAPDRSAWRPFPDWEGRQDSAPLGIGWAVVASIVVHGAILLATRPGGAAHGAVSIAPRVIQAVLAPAQAPPEPPITIVTERSEVVAKAMPSVPTTQPRPAASPKPAAEPPAKKSAARGVASLMVTGEPVVDRTQLGDYANRQISEFRAEIDRGVRLAKPLVVPYPAAALREGREDSVAVWIVVDHTGQADEIDVIEGSPEFADEVVAAVKATTFLPAERKLRPIRFPIALAFHFRMSGSSGADGVAAR